MSDNSLIEWCTATWNFLIGCTKKSAGCMHCYAIRQAWRMMHNPNPKIAKKFEGTVHKDSKGELNWTGRINFDGDSLALPLNWRLPRRIFVNSLSDLFHPNVKDEWIAAAFGVMMATQHHTYQILTKHPERAVEWFKWIDSHKESANSFYHPREMCEEAALVHVEACHLQADMSDAWPLPNVHILTSVEDQPSANERISWLLRIPAVVRGVSAEPLLGPIDLARAGLEIRMTDLDTPDEVNLDWVVAGGESGPNARPMHPDWARSLRDQCVAAGVPFFFKQHGDWIGSDQQLADRSDPVLSPSNIHHRWEQRKPSGPPHFGMNYSIRVGKKAAGRLLDGQEWNEYPREEVS